MLGGGGVERSVCCEIVARGFCLLNSSDEEKYNGHDRQQHNDENSRTTKNNRIEMVMLQMTTQGVNLGGGGLLQLDVLWRATTLQLVVLPEDGSCCLPQPIAHYNCNVSVPSLPPRKESLL